MLRKALTPLGFVFWLAGFVLLLVGHLLALALRAGLQRSGWAEVSLPEPPRWAAVRQR